jgi:hypothetical protein
MLVTAACLYGCDDRQEPQAPTESVTSTCNATLTRAQSNPLVVSANTALNDGVWTLNNTGNLNVTASSQLQKRTGQVTSVTSETGLPFTVAPGGHHQVTVSFSVGAAGTGGINVTLTTTCGTKTGSYNVTVQ